MIDLNTVNPRLQIILSFMLTRVEVIVKQIVIGAVLD